MKAWQLFKSRKNWCQGTWATDKYGTHVTPESRDAVAVCAAGAIRRAYDFSFRYKIEMKLHNYVVSKTQFNCIPAWNDHKNQRWNRVKAVLKKLDI